MLQLLHRYNEMLTADIHAMTLTTRRLEDSIDANQKVSFVGI